LDLASSLPFCAEHAPTMLTDHLVLAALDSQDNVAIVLPPTPPGQPPVIEEVNDAFHRLTGYPRGWVDGKPLAILSRPSDVSPEWRQLLDAIDAGEPLRGEVPCFTAANELFWFGFTLTHVRDPRSEQVHPVLTGRDITVDRWTSQEQTSTNALIAMAFQKIDAPVVLVREGGRIIVANLALAALTGYTATELDSRSIDELTHPSDVVAASPGQSRQRVEGAGCRIRLMPKAKDGRVIPVWLTSELLESESFGRVNVVTLLPEPTEAAPIGRVERVSLQAVRAACGETWEKMSSRLLMMAESVVKHRIGPRDVFARSVNADFMIWFATGDEKETAACVAIITREIRIRLLGELGESDVAGTTGMTVNVESAAPTSTRPLQRDTAQQENHDIIRARALEIVAGLSADTPVEVTRIVDRDDRSAGLVWADLPHAARRRLNTALGILSEDALAEAGLLEPELLHLRFAIAGIKRDLVEGQRRAWLLPVPCAAMVSWKRRKRLLEALRALQPSFHARLRGLIADVSGLPDVNLSDWFDQLAPLLKGIGVLSHAPELPSPATLRPPCALVAIDLQAGPPPSEEIALKLFAVARRSTLPVLVRTGVRAEARHWRDLGATLFAITRPGP
jgi:PAS domain S-box-containing protein